MARVLIDALPGETRAAVVDADDRLLDLLVLREDRPSFAGNVYLGRVERIDRGLGAAFVEIGLARPGFLPLGAVDGPLAVGDVVGVRVTREPSTGKGAKLTAWEATTPPADARPPRLLQASDPLARLIRAADPESVTVEGAELKQRLAAALPDLRSRIGVHRSPTPLFDAEDLSAQIATLLQPDVALPGGGLLRVEPVDTLTAIDVDAAGHTGSDSSRLALEVDLAAATEIVRQIRLRALSGLIVIDFLELETKDVRRRLARTLQDAFEAAGLDASVSPMRASGLVEVARPRRRLPLHEIMTEPAGRIADAVTAALDLVRRAWREARANPGRPLTLVAAPEVAQALHSTVRPAFDDLARRLGATPELRSDPACPRECPRILIA